MSDNPASTPDPSGVARTPTGDIATQTQTTTPAATTPQTSTTPEEPTSLVNQPAGSLVNQKPAAEGGAPATYSQFTAPEGYEFNADDVKEVSGLFRKMNLSQEQAQELLDFHANKLLAGQNAPFDLWQKTQEEWVKEVKADPQLGPRLNEVKTTISRAIDGLGDPKLARDFREAMDYTGAGNNPSFIRAFYKLSQMVTEGRHVAGNGPSPAAQPNGQRPASAAKAMYPNLP